MLDLEAIRKRHSLIAAASMTGPGLVKLLSDDGAKAYMQAITTALLEDLPALCDELESARAMFGHAHREVIRLREAGKAVIAADDALRAAILAAVDGERHA